MQIPHDKFCVLPWISLEASPIGSVRPCCLAEHELKNDNGEKFHLSKHSLNEARHSTDLKKLRQDFLDGKQPDTCRKCWNEERAGRTSKRMHTLDRLKDFVDDQSWTLDAKPLIFLDLKLGNICNLKCRICGSWSSSTFASEELSAIPDIAQRKQSFHYKMLRDGAWPKNTDQFWQELEHHMHDIRYIEFTGGEPFMIVEHFDLLKRIVDAGLAGNIDIHYNTNGTHWPEHAQEIWQHFHHVEIAFSIDDVGQRFEYQRTGACWREVNENIKKARQLRLQCPNVSLQVCCTINILNVLSLSEVAEWIDRQNFDFVYWNMLHEPSCWNISHLPFYAREYIANRLSWARFDARHRSEIDRAVTFMRTGGIEDITDTLTKIKELDARRQQSLSDVAPELAYILKYDAPPV